MFPVIPLWSQVLFLLSFGYAVLYIFGIPCSLVSLLEKGMDRRDGDGTTGVGPCLAGWYGMVLT